MHDRMHLRPQMFIYVYKQCLRVPPQVRMQTLFWVQFDVLM